MNKESKPLQTNDNSAIELVKECLKGDVTFGINFDRIQTNSETGKYMILEYLLCDERQFKNNVTPFTSHPNRYFHLNKQKFIKLWEVTKNLNADLILINYSKKNTQYENEILLMKDFKQITGTTRKYAIPLLEYFDKIKFTFRADNGRRLIK